MVPGADTVLSHLRRGALEYCVLALMADEDRYGLDLARELTRDGVLMSGEGTLCPLLARLRKAGWVTTTWQESAGGPPRRYYSLTLDGRDALEAFGPAWKQFRDAVDAALVTGGDAR